MPIIDLTKRTEPFGRLRATRYAGRARWECLCTCGNTCVVASGNLKNGHTQSCGCLAEELSGVKQTKHGHSRSPGGEKVRTLTYNTWRSVKERCLNPTSRAYHKYGAKGIKVCDRWLDFAAFLADMGERPSRAHTIDRFPDRAGNYEPGNCRWATKQQQSRNQKSNRIVTHAGRSLTVAEWAAETGIKSITIRWRLDSGWSAEAALTKPARKKLVG